MNFFIFKKETEENQKKIITGKKKYEYFGFKLLWELIQDESKLPNNLLKLCLATLGDLFSNFTRIQKSEKEKYLNECFENFKSGNSVSQSLILSLHVFASMQTNSMYGKGTTCKKIMDLIYFFFKIIFQNINDGVCKFYFINIKIKIYYNLFLINLN